MNRCVLYIYIYMYAGCRGGQGGETEGDRPEAPEAGRIHIYIYIYMYIMMSIKYYYIVI